MIGGAPRAAVSSAATSIAGAAAFVAGASSGTPITAQRAARSLCDVATSATVDSTPRTRSMITPVFAPMATAIGLRVKNQHFER